MTESKNRPWLRGGRGRALLAALVFALAGAILPAAGRAADPIGPARPGELPQLLASVTILSEAAMARETGAGIQPTPLINNPSGHSRVLLWDEMRAPPDLPPGATSGTVTLSTGGVGK